MDVFDFFPVHERKFHGKVCNSELKKTVFDCDYMIPFSKAREAESEVQAAENDFPWSLSKEKCEEILSPYRKHPFISIVEVGTHIGTTATRFAHCIRDNPDSYVLCVDTWLSDVADYILRREGVKYNLKEGNDHLLFERFLRNVKSNKLEKSIIPLRLPSLQAGQILYYYGLKFDVIYIDASHEYLNVKLDLEMFWNLLTEDGCMFGDDYHIEGVKKAVDEFAEKYNLKMETYEGVYFSDIQQLGFIFRKKNDLISGLVG